MKQGPRARSFPSPNWWGPLDDPAIVHKEIAIAYREWATAVAPILRAELEASSDSVVHDPQETWPASIGSPPHHQLTTCRPKMRCMADHLV
jgi:hypothetical protein